MSSLFVRVTDHMRRLVIRTVARTSPVPMTRLGSDYGGWWVPNDVLTCGGIAYCAGAGEDITFDIALYQQGFTVHCFDPTPRAIAHVNSKKPMDDRFTFHAIGWWDEKTTLRFYVPQDPKHVSHSVVNLQRTSDFFEASVDSASAIMHSLGHEKLSLVKMDIEGAELRVLASILSDGIRPEVLCVEFDQPKPIRKTLTAIQDVLSAGYHLRHIDRWNYTFQLAAAKPVDLRTR